MSRKRSQKPSRLLLWGPVVLVLVLVGSAFAAFEFDAAERLGWGPDRSNPAEIAPPKGVEIPAAPAAPAVADPATHTVPDAAAVERALAPYVNDEDLGRRRIFEVSGIDGKAVWKQGSGTVTPASTLKILTTTAALESLGGDRRFSTTVRALDSGSAQPRIVLVGGGDPLLARKPATDSDYPKAADLTTLARRTAVQLRADGNTSVRLDFDDSLFEGSGVSSDWPANYITDYVVSPIRALWVDKGTLPGKFELSDDPAADAAKFFAAQLKKTGIKVLGRPSRTAGAVGDQGEQVAAVRSVPVDQIVEEVLKNSNNEAAEVLAHQVALEEGESADFAGGARAVRAVLTRLGVPLKGARILDGSGLSRDNRLQASTLLKTLAVAADPDYPQLRPVITGLPVAGFDGSLSTRFVTGDRDGRGRVRVKTGTLTGVHSFAGITTDLDGNVMLMALMTDKVKPEDTLDARATLDDLAAALGGCRCSP